MKLEQILALVEIQLEVDQLRAYLSFVEKNLPELLVAQK
jgi:hypothetical protein